MKTAEGNFRLTESLSLLDSNFKCSNHNSEKGVGMIRLRIHGNSDAYIGRACTRIYIRFEPRICFILEFEGPFMALFSAYD